MNKIIPKKMKNFNKGFTLIELLVVIAIIGILSSIVLASLTSSKQKALDASIKTTDAQIRLALDAYYASNGSYPVPSAGPGAYCIGSQTCMAGGIEISTFISLGEKYNKLIASSINEYNKNSILNVAYADTVPGGDFEFPTNGNFPVTPDGNFQGFVYIVDSDGLSASIIGGTSQGAYEKNITSDSGWVCNTTDYEAGCNAIGGTGGGSGGSNTCACTDPMNCEPNNSPCETNTCGQGTQSCDNNNCGPGTESCDANNCGPGTCYPNGDPMNCDDGVADDTCYPGGGDPMTCGESGTESCDTNDCTLANDACDANNCGPGTCYPNGGDPMNCGTGPGTCYPNGGDPMNCGTGTEACYPNGDPMNCAPARSACYNESNPNPNNCSCY